MRNSIPSLESDNRDYDSEGFASEMAFDPKSRLTEPGLPESDTLGLCLDSHDDALHHIDKLTERGKNFLAVDKLNFVERYKVGRLVIKLEFMTNRDFGQYQLIFVAVPSRRGEDTSTQPSRSRSTQ